MVDIRGFFEELGLSGVVVTIIGVVVSAILHGFLEPVVEKKWFGEEATEEQALQAEAATAGVLAGISLIYGGLVYGGAIPFGEIGDFFGSLFGGSLLYQSGVLTEVGMEYVTGWIMA